MMRSRSHEQRLLELFLNPRRYPHPVDGPIRHYQTHVSHIFLAGPFAYKLKKAVRFPFVDASTLARRLHWCRRELLLNRRLAPELYLGLTPVVRRGGRLAIGGRGPVAEWAIRMRRLPEDRMMDRQLARGAMSSAHIAAVMDRLIPFFRSAARGRAIARFGQPDQVARLVLGNLQECQPLIGTVLSATDAARLDAAYRQFLALREPLLAARVRERRIIEGHGDLRAENICLTEPPTIFDCVEHQAAFRCGDVVNDLSFLLMDLEFRGRADLARTALRRYMTRITDPRAPDLLPFYACHRALVRAKVRALAWQQQRGQPGASRLLAIARGHVRQALGYARQFAPPRLVITCGLIGTGKSTLARTLAERLGAVWLRTDEIRLREFGHLRRAGVPDDRTVYSARVSRMVYERLMRRAEAVIARGGSVVCDGTFLKAEGRQRLRDTARRRGASCHGFECVVPKPVAIRRIRHRLRAGRDLSEARPELYDRMRVAWEPVRGWPPSAWTRLSTRGRPERVAAAAIGRLQQVWTE